MFRLGDAVEEAISKVGVTQSRVEKWLGRECNCSSRRDRLNALSGWANRVLSGNLERAIEYLALMMHSECREDEKKEEQ